MKIYVYFAISKLPGAKISLSNGNFDQIWPNCCNFLNMLHCEMDRQFHVRVLFWPLLGLFSSFKHNQFKNVVPNSCNKFLAFFGFQKTPKLSLDSQSARIFISEHSDTYSHKIWNVIYRLVQIYKRIAKKFYPKLTIYLSTVFCRGH